MFMVPQIKRQVFNEDILYLIRKEIEYLKSGDVPLDIDNELFHRSGKHNDPFFKEIHRMITERVSNWVGINLKPSYVYTSMYFTGQGFCPEHTDREQCIYTLDLCVNQNEPWPLKVAGAEYLLDEGDAILYSGTSHVHSRDKIQPSNFCDLVFFHFVPINFTGSLD